MNFDKTVIYFTAGDIPTTAEQAAIDRLKHQYEHVKVRNGARNSQYSAVGEAGRLESAHALAGTIPAAYKTASGNTAVDTTVFPGGEVSVAAAADFEASLILPSATPSIAANGGTTQLRAVVAELNDETDAITLTDRTSGTGVTWSSANEAKATVSSGGLVTGANGGTGSVVITHTYTAGGQDISTTRSVTLT